jgi:hypothetical protein
LAPLALAENPSPLRACFGHDIRNISANGKMKPKGAAVKGKSNVRSKREKRDDDVMNVRNNAYDDVLTRQSTLG